MGGHFLMHCGYGVTCYVIIQPVTTIIALITQITGKYGEGSFHATVAYPYLSLVSSVAQGIVGMV